MVPKKEFKYEKFKNKKRNCISNIIFTAFCSYLVLAAVYVLPISMLQDYWSDDFDVTKNCEQEELIKKLQKETSPPRCSSKTAGIKSVTHIIV